MVNPPARGSEFAQIIIELSILEYDQLRKKCQFASPELSTLAHFTFGTRVGKTIDERTIKIGCDKNQANALLEFANRNCPDLAPHIQHCIDQHPPTHQLLPVPRRKRLRDHP